MSFIFLDMNIFTGCQFTEDAQGFFDDYGTEHIFIKKMY